MPRAIGVHLAVAGHHLMLVVYGRLTFQPACVVRGLNKGLNCVCARNNNNNNNNNSWAKYKD